MTHHGSATHNPPIHMNAATISSVTFLVKNSPNLTRIAYFFFLPSQYPAPVSQPARPPRLRGADSMWPSPVPLCCLWLPRSTTCSRQQDETQTSTNLLPFCRRCTLSYLKAFAQAATAFLSSTGCPSQPSLSLSPAGPYLTLKTPKLKCFLLKKSLLS